MQSRPDYSCCHLFGLWHRPAGRHVRNWLGIRQQLAGGVQRVACNKLAKRCKSYKQLRLSPAPHAKRSVAASRKLNSFIMTANIQHWHTHWHTHTLAHTLRGAQVQRTLDSNNKVNESHKIKFNPLASRLCFVGLSLASYGWPRPQAAAPLPVAASPHTAPVARFIPC